MNLDLETWTDGELATLATAGRQAAFSVIIRRHRDPIYRLIRGHVGDADEALDLVQETFVSAHQALARYDGARPFRAWLARIAINKCRDWGRRRTVRRLLFRADPLDGGVFEVEDDSPSPWQIAQDREELRALNQAIAALPASLKEPLLLRTVEELSQAEVAAALDISEKAVETRVRRARLRLCQMLGRDR